MNKDTKNYSYFAHKERTVFFSGNTGTKNRKARAQVAYIKSLEKKLEQMDSQIPDKPQCK